MNLKGKIAIVTGAVGDIGSQAVATFVAHGAKVALVDLDKGRLDEAVAMLPPKSCVGIAADVRVAGDVRRYSQTAVEHFGGPVDIFFANAGIEGAVAGLEDYPEGA